MHWKFTPFFSIEILHGKYPPPAVGQAAPPAPVFSVTPLSGTLERLLQMGWVYRPYPTGGGGILYAEKIVAPDGTATLRTKPAPHEGFSFALQLQTPSLLESTRPYAPTPANFPAYSGRAPLFYFDNLLATPQGADVFSLTDNNAVGFSEFGSRLPGHFTFRPAQPGVKNIEMLALAPGGATKAFAVDEKTNSTEIKLPENGYRLTQQPTGTAETVFLTDDFLPHQTLGVIRIFQPPGADWEPYRRYQIFFDKT
ncbi:MAG: hypothetical protein SFV22_01995 [Saprospiraceae bacterium]|nr:hypothetical protein [Saprospiraceae bacterium]